MSEASLTNRQAQALKQYIKGRPSGQILTLARLSQKIDGTEAKAATEVFGGMTVAWGALALASLAASPVAAPLLVLAAAGGTALAVKGLFTKNRSEQARVGLHAIKAAAGGQTGDSQTNLALISEDKNGYKAITSTQAPAARKGMSGMRLGRP